MQEFKIRLIFIRVIAWFDLNYEDRCQPETQPAANRIPGPPQARVKCEGLDGLVREQIDFAYGEDLFDAGVELRV